MQGKYLGAVAFVGSAALAAVSQLGTPKRDLEFTKAALPPPEVIDLRPVLSPAFVVLPVDLGPLAQRAQLALPETLANVREWLSDAACGRRSVALVCTTAKLEGTVTRSGPVDLKVEGTVLRLVVPVKYALTATGVGWASNLTEQKAGETNLEVSFLIKINPAGGLDVEKRDDPNAADAPISLLKANVRLSHLLEAHLKPVARAAEEDLTRALASLPVKASVAHAFEALSQVELGQGSGLWLRGAPDYYAAGSLVSKGRTLTYQIPIASHLAIAEAGNGTPPGGKRTAGLSLEAAPAGPSRIRIAVPIDLEAMRQAAEAVFVNGETFESRADRFSDPVQVKVRATRVYPAMRQIGLELDVDVTTRKGVTHSGKLHLAGRPVLDVAAGTVTLADLTFPPVSGKDAAGQAPDIPRLGTEPFASKFAAVAKLDVSNALATLLPRARQMLNQRVSDDLMLQAELTEAKPVGLELARDGAWLLVDLAGSVNFVQDGSTQAKTTTTTATSTSTTGATAATPKADEAKPAKAGVTARHKVHHR